MDEYIVLTRDDDLWLVGPFPPGGPSPADYGITAQETLWVGDLRWQTISLKDTYGLRIEAPAAIDIEPGVYQSSWKNMFKEDK